MTDVHINNPSDFTTYPNNRVCAIIDNRIDAERAVNELTAKGIQGDHLDVLYGKVGADVLDADSTHHGFIAKIITKLRSYGDVENQSMHLYEAALEQGSYVVAVPAKNEEEKEIIRQALSSSNARDINYFSTWYVEALKG